MEIRKIRAFLYKNHNSTELHCNEINTELILAPRVINVKYFHHQKVSKAV